MAVAATPALASLYLSATVPVPWQNMLLSVLKIVLVPVVLGIVVNTYLGHRLTRVRAVFPAISVGAIVLIIATDGLFAVLFNILGI